MCGIGGAYHSESARARMAVEAMNRAMAHRGPDDEGIEVFGSFGGTLAFGHRRLAIIDVTSAGHQPMGDPETGNWITFNGEIYNFRELRGVLSGKGCAFRTQTDTEVILKAYAVWGQECAERFRGIFAFGIWDSTRGMLLLARDQLGVKPLYYYQGPGCFLFGSEVRALLATGMVQRSLDSKGLRSYLAYGSVQDPYTLVDGVKSLLPGATLQWQGGSIGVRRYWRLPLPKPGAASREAVYESVTNRLTDAVSAQLIADVPLGAFLSGGIDSTAIVAIMQRVSSTPVKTFSLVFQEAEYDERRYAKCAAQHVGSDHTEVELAGETVRGGLSRAIAAYDQPSVDGLNTYYVSMAARDRGLTVALSGVGGDEVFGGYGGYYRALLAERWARPIRFFRPVVPEVFRRYVQASSIPETVRKVVTLMETSRHPYFASRRLFDEQQIAALLEDTPSSASLWEPERYDVIELEAKAYDPINRASALELQTYMLSTLLRDTDQMSMAHALEVRVPLIDHLLVEHLFAVPGHVKVSREQPKPLLTLALGDSIPRECIFRPKRGFVMPFERWLRESLHEDMRETLCAGHRDSRSQLAGRALSDVWARFEQRRLSWSRVWGLFVLEKWIARHMCA